MDLIRKNFSVEKDGDWIVINTGVLDRDNDYLPPSGGDLGNYVLNPVLMWGHNYYDPWALIGKAEEISSSADYIKILPKFREPETDEDPIRIIKALWDAGLLRAASIGFNSSEFKENDEGGITFEKWELLEVSLVPIPANQEALRLAVKGLPGHSFEKEFNAFLKQRLKKEEEREEESSSEFAEQVEEIARSVVEEFIESLTAEEKEPNDEDDDIEQIPGEILEAIVDYLEEVGNYLPDKEEAENE